MKRCVHLIAALLLCLTLGLHWVALQSVAWTTMVIERSCNASLRTALATTFDGQHPCKLCQVVRAGTSAGETAKLPLKQSKLEIIRNGLSFWTPVPAAAPVFLTQAEDPPESRRDAPPLPPPRVA
ncbi:MAG: hypothetical protein JNL10_00200 [Verrucomicrobiales bacterium]|nr:hypothetical protein [Verrucomicrobiales bacterium]